MTLHMRIFFIIGFISGYAFASPANAAPGPAQLKISLNKDLFNATNLSDANVSGAVFIFIGDAFQVLNLNWNQNTDEVDGYYVYRGDSPSSVAPPKISTVLRTNQTPRITYRQSDLNLKDGDPICFRIKAYNEIASSEFSEAVCTTLQGIKHIAFYIDDDTLSGAPVSVDTASPWIMNGGPFDLNTLDSGTHTVTAAVNYNDGRISKHSSEFINKKKLLSPTGLTTTIELMIDAPE